MPASNLRLFGQVFTPSGRGLGVVTVGGGRITAIDAVARRPRGVEGDESLRILPGLIDIQINGAFGQDFSDPAADLSLVCREIPSLGVTAFLPTVISSPADRYAACLANLTPPGTDAGAVALGVHIEGPFLSPARAGTHEPSFLREPSWAEASSWLDRGNVRIVTLAPERPGALDLIGSLVARDVVVSMGHTDATWPEAAAGVEAGIRLGTHLFNAMRPLSHRDPGVAGYLLANETPTSFSADGVHLAPETLQLICRAKRPDDLVLVTDALAGLGQPKGSFELAGQRLVRDGLVARRSDGTLSGSLLSLNLAIRNLTALGIDEAVAIAAATANPARLLGDAERGTLKVGGRADITVVDREWTVVRTLVAGESVFARSTAAP